MSSNMAAHADFKNPVVALDRLPPADLHACCSKEYDDFPTPRNLNYFWNFGALAMVMLVLMIVTGIVLAMQLHAARRRWPSTRSSASCATCNYGWLMRYMHMNGASMFFIAVYIHIFRGLYYGSYKAPRELLWMLGVVILLLMMATAFMGYVLPWGQMSFWGATVITNLFSAIPVVGDRIVTWLWGGFAVDNPTLNRFFALHYLLPFVHRRRGVPARRGAARARLEQPARHRHRRARRTRVPFHPYYTMKDSFGLVRVPDRLRRLRVLRAELPGPPGQLHPGQPAGDAGAHRAGMVLPAVLRDPARGAGQAGRRARMFGSIAVLFVLPWLDTSKVRSARFRPLYRQFFWVLVVDCVVLRLCRRAAARRRLA